MSANPLGGALFRAKPEENRRGQRQTSESAEGEACLRFHGLWTEIRTSPSRRRLEPRVWEIANNVNAASSRVFESCRPGSRMLLKRNRPARSSSPRKRVRPLQTGLEPPGYVTHPLRTDRTGPADQISVDRHGGRGKTWRAKSSSDGGIMRCFGKAALRIWAFSGKYRWCIPRFSCSVSKNRPDMLDVQSSEMVRYEHCGYGSFRLVPTIR